MIRDEASSSTVPPPRTKRTRARFAERFGLDMRTLEPWEQGRRKPDRATETYLRLIDKAPDTAAEPVVRLKRIECSVIVV